MDQKMITAKEARRLCTTAIKRKREEAKRVDLMLQVINGDIKVAAMHGRKTLKVHLDDTWSYAQIEELTNRLHETPRCFQVTDRWIPDVDEDDDGDGDMSVELTVSWEKQDKREKDEDSD